MSASFQRLLCMTMVCLTALAVVACRSAGKAPVRLPLPGLDAWRLTGGTPAAYAVHLDTLTQVDGRRSVSLTSTPAASQESYASLIQTIRADRYRGDRIRISGYLRMQDLARGGSLWLRVDGRGGIISFDDMSEPRRHRTGTTDWVLHEVVLDVPHDAIGLAFGAVIAGRGVLWVDQLRLEVVSDDIQATSAPAPPESADSAAVTMQRERYRTRPFAPANMSFEGR